ncbi:tRNA glutamyl-Q(34) synthetase GluQRS [Chitinimonas lacunae]|uniref:Glutamyl-Q tRNA(Asp) synthetase n=1 Tax=Chitinimonas lacunae TaxID=1963018 RepID=A0ABV8ML99_9NEIS
MVIFKDTPPILPPRYRGRFAPSPSGPLHIGSLLAAMASRLEARAHGGEWLVRIEDLDPPREQPGASAAILRTLEALGFEWDGEVSYQSQRHALYEAALQQLREAGLAYPCGCTRREIADSSLRGIDGPVYPGYCRHGLAPGRSARAWRLRVAPGVEIAYTDAIQGRRVQALASEVGDFILRRADGYFAYQLAVVVDDAAQGVTDVVRGADLLDSTPRQVYLCQCLGLKAFRYAHLPVLVNEAGEKLSKQTLAPAVEVTEGAALLVRVLRYLGQTVPKELETVSIAEVWRWADAHWSLEAVPKRLGIPVQAAMGGM